MDKFEKIYVVQKINKLNVFTIARFFFSFSLSCFSPFSLFFESKYEQLFLAL